MKRDIRGCCQSLPCNPYTGALEDPKLQQDLPHPKSGELKSECNVHFSFRIQSSFKVSGLVQTPQIVQGPVKFFRSYPFLYMSVSLLQV